MASQAKLSMRAAALVFSLLGVHLVNAMRTIKTADQFEELSTSSADRLSQQNPRKNLARHLLVAPADYGTSTSSSGVNVQSTGSSNDAKADIYTNTAAGPDVTSSSISSGVTATNEGGDLLFESGSGAALEQGNAAANGYNSANVNAVGKNEDSEIRAQSQQNTYTQSDNDSTTTNGSGYVSAVGENTNVDSRQDLAAAATRGEGSGTAGAYGGFGTSGANTQRGHSQTGVSSTVSDNSDVESSITSYADTHATGPHTQVHNSVGGGASAARGASVTYGNNQASADGSGDILYAQTHVDQAASAYEDATLGYSGQSVEGRAVNGNLNTLTQQNLVSKNENGAGSSYSQASNSGEGDEVLGRTNSGSGTFASPDAFLATSNSESHIGSANGSSQSGIKSGTLSENSTNNAQGYAASDSQGSGRNFSGYQKATSNGAVTDRTAEQTNDVHSTVELQNGQVASKSQGGSQATFGDGYGEGNGHSEVNGSGESLKSTSTVDTRGSAGENNISASSNASNNIELESGYLDAHESTQAAGEIGDVAGYGGVRRDQVLAGSGATESGTSSTVDINRNGGSSVQVNASDRLSTSEGFMTSSQQGGARLTNGDATSSGQIKATGSAAGLNNNINSESSNVHSTNVDGSYVDGTSYGTQSTSTDAGYTKGGIHTGTRLSNSDPYQETEGRAATQVSGSGEKVSTNQAAHSSGNLTPNSSSSSTYTGNNAAANTGSINGDSDTKSYSTNGEATAKSTSYGDFGASGQGVAGNSFGGTSDTSSGENAISETYSGANASARQGTVNSGSGGNSAVSNEQGQGYSSGYNTVSATGENSNVYSATSTQSASTGDHISTTGVSTAVGDALEGEASGTSATHGSAIGADGHVSTGGAAGTFYGEGAQVAGSTTSSTNSYSTENSSGTATNDETWGRTVDGSLNINSNTGTCSGVDCGSAY